MNELRILAKQFFKLFAIVFVLVGIVFLWLLNYKPYVKSVSTSETDEIATSVNWEPRNAISEINNMPAEVKKGYYLIAESSKYMGPKAVNPADRYSGNNLACANCHLKQGAQAGSGSWVGILERFPQFGGRGNKIGTIEGRINGCMERSMNGRMLPVDSDKMDAIVAYMAWLSEGLPENRKAEFKGYPKIEIPNVAVNLEKGSQVYQKECVICHGENGEGVLNAVDGKSYTYPPLWGPDSFNDGAGMNRVITSAEFIKSNMPYLQATWDNPKLTDEEAYHVAGYINSFTRPHKLNTENDYPDKKLKPVSTPYGPWVDDFSAEQHKYGPFPPIMDFYKQKYGIIKTK
ncbi:c-type cytochrome [Maribacter hydrothermalis]|uniref:Cytochrome C n=1 Tax=Maribacter hydrothermalis TaxID=1836467 RepID=A0A1B7YZ29_9FLAO|nr:c-type cytochrome [Maribacter hydrothermalis]APQ16081.1 cytochrome C [Maribacter hydrothermalis]OBR35741.1 cytochrome C [Maribacter hydrothermalis]